MRITGRRNAAAGALILLAASCATNWTGYRTVPHAGWTVADGDSAVDVDYAPSGPSPRVAVVHLSGKIDAKMAAEFSVQIQSLDGADYIVIDMDSPGGRLSDAKDMMLTMLVAPAPTVCVAHTAASGMFGVFEACHWRLMVPDGELMLHRARLAQQPDDLLEWIQDRFDLEEINDRWLHLACARLSIPYEQCQDAVAGDRQVWLDPEEAIAVDAADEMIPDLDSIFAELREP